MGCGSSSAASENTTTQKTNEPKPTTDNKPVPEDKKGGGTADKTPVPEDKKGGGSAGNQFANDAVQSHNKYRAMHGAPAMRMAQDLNDYAQKYANEIAKKDNMAHSKCTLPSGERVGENLYCYWSSNTTDAPTAEMAVQSWYDEIKDYNFNSPGFAMDTGHFTQVVWKGSVELGMAWAKAEGGTTYVVANYRPAGNMMGDFENHVAPKM